MLYVGLYLPWNGCCHFRADVMYLELDYTIEWLSYSLVTHNSYMYIKQEELTKVLFYI